MRRILFVDDEARILDGLRRMLHTMRSEWELSFAKSGAEALELMKRTPFEILVTDVRMPGMDGVELLTAVMAEYPNTIRIVLSGHSEHAAIVRSVGPAHQYLAKPCQADDLLRVIKSACALRELLANEPLQETIAGMRSLPSLPQAFVALERELRSSDPSIRRIGAIIAEDVGMTAKVLQLVNSAFFGLSRPASRPEDAAKLLGIETLRALVLNAHVFTQFSGAARAGLQLEALQSHNMTTAVLAQRIAQAEACSALACDHALMAGLLHDTGKLILADRCGDWYRNAMKIADADHMPDLEAERQVFDTTHAEVGAYLLGMWGLPDGIVEAVAYHHNPSLCVGDEFAPLTAVHVANVLAREQSLGAEVPPEIDNEYIARLGLTDRLPAWREAQAALAEEAHHD